MVYEVDSDTFRALPEHAPVLILGGSMVGLSLSTFLGVHGVHPIVIEKHPSNNPLPRAAHFHLRTLEYYRQVGLEGKLQEESAKHYSRVPQSAFSFTNAGIIAVRDLASRQTAVVDEDITKGLSAVSPSLRLFLAQHSLEPVLREHIESNDSATLCFGTKVESVRQSETGCTVTVSHNGDSRTVTADYLDGYGVLSSSMTIYFKADLTQIPGAVDAIRKNGVIYVNHPELQGFFRLDRDCQGGFLAVMLSGSGANASTYIPKDFDEAHAEEWIRIALGSQTTMPIKVTLLSPWSAQADWSESIRAGRIFVRLLPSTFVRFLILLILTGALVAQLAGDAAHAVPPIGGYGGNTGIHDAYNLAWKLGLVLQKKAHPCLLSTYEEERLPVIKFTVEQAYARYCDRFVGVERAKEKVVDDLRVEIGYAFAGSSAIVPHHSFPIASYSTSIPTEDSNAPTAGPGFRAPHCWLHRAGEKISTLDLYGTDFVLLTPEHAASSWGTAAAAASRSLSCIPIVLYGIGKTTPVSDPGNTFTTVYKLAPGSKQAVLVRPDGTVGARFDGDGDEQMLARVMSSILGFEAWEPTELRSSS
ncbi:hypothetical protein JCM1841_005406 [Sporobolomyces salmonicolor]